LRSWLEARAPSTELCRQGHDRVERCFVSTELGQREGSVAQRPLVIRLPPQRFVEGGDGGLETARVGHRLDEIGAFIAAQVDGQWDVPWTGKVGAKGWMSTRAAITALGRATRMSDLLRDCVAFTGDVDTVAAIAMAAGSCCSALEQDLPGHLYDSLENGPWGRDELARLDGLLMARVSR
jgi:hypothetical protein